MRESHSLKIRNQYFRLLVCTFMLVLLIFLSFTYSYFSRRVNNMLSESGAEDIEETYQEVVQLFEKTTEYCWKNLRLLDAYYQDTSLSLQEYREGMQDFKQLCSFTDFYFIDDMGQYITIDGKRGVIDLGGDTSKIMDDKENVIVEASLSNQENMLFYVHPTDNGSFNGFEYQAIAFGYNNEELMKTLEISAYDGRSYPLIIYPNGSIIIANFTQDNTYSYNNIYTLLDVDQVNLQSSTMEEIQSYIENRETETVVISIGNKGYYLSCVPLEIQDWVLLSFTPIEVVNSNSNLIRNQQTRFLVVCGALIVLLVCGGLALVFLLLTRKKDIRIGIQNELFNIISTSLDEVYVLFDTQTLKIEFVSENVERLLGFSEQQLIHDNSILGNILNDSDETVGNVVARLKNGGEVSKEMTIENVQTHQERLYRISMFLIDNSQKAVTVISDRSRERRIRREIEDALASAQSANAAKTSFLSNISHDIRTPLNGIKGFSELIANFSDDPQKVREYNARINDSTRYLQSLVDDVLDYSKIEAGKTTLVTESKDIIPIVSRLDNMFRPQCEEKHQTFNFNIDVDNNCIVEVDELRLTQILVNLLSNAIKYTPEGGAVDFALSCSEYHQLVTYTFTIQDNGIGMSEEFLKTIYEPFSREIESGTNKVKGTGLGMAITKNLIDLMGGMIHIESKQHVGSTIVITIPFKVVEKLDNNQNITDENDNTTTTSIKGLNILAGEDNEINSELLFELLKVEECHVDIVENGQEVVNKFSSSDINEYDLILMDIQMPIMDGYQAARAIRKCSHPRALQIPIIAMTANAFSDDVAKALDSGMNAHLAKPIDMRILKSTIKDVLGR